MHSSLTNFKGLAYDEILFVQRMVFILYDCILFLFRLPTKYHSSAILNHVVKENSLGVIFLNENVFDDTWIKTINYNFLFDTKI